MFNFNLQNKAFEELNAEQFRFVYFLNNTLSMVNKTNNTPNNNTIEMYNGYMMDKLGLSVRMVQYHIKALEQLGYIKVVRPIGRNARKQPNKITINNAINDAMDCALSENNTFKTTNNAINNAINDAMDCTPNNKKIKENNNNLSILELKDLGPKVTEDKKENKIKEKVNEMRNAVLNEMKDNEIQTSTPDEKNTNFNFKEPVYGNLTDDLFDEIFGMEENEMSDNGTSVMNVQHNINEMTTSTQGNIIILDSDNGENKVQSGKVITNCSIFTENCPKPYLTPQIPLTPLSSPNKAAGCVENTSMDNLYTSTEKTQPDAKEVAKTQNNAYSIQEWMTEYEKLLLQVENTDIEDVRFNSILDEGIKLFESFPKNKGNYQRAMQDLRYWASNKLDYNKTFKISEQWGKYYRAA